MKNCFFFDFLNAVFTSSIFCFIGTLCERFIDFLIKRFDVELKDGYVMTINKTKKGTLGYFKPIGCSDNYKNERDHPDLYSKYLHRWYNR